MSRHLRYPPQVIWIEYDCRGSRISKPFLDPYKARRFYIKKDKAGKRPKVRKD